MDVKPGWKTTEFWLSIIAQGLALAVIFGVVAPADKATLEQALTAIIGAVVTILANGYVIVEYIRGRTALKQNEVILTLDDPVEDEDEMEHHGDGGGFPRLAALFFAATVGLWLVGSPVQAQQPATAQVGEQLSARTVCGLPWRDYIQYRLDQIERDRRQQPQSDPAIAEALRQLAETQRQMMQMLNRPQQQSQPPQIIVLGGPYQQLPINGQPRQELPIGGPPRQDLPIGGQPRQDLPPAGQPKQDVPIGGQPKQPLPVPGPIAQPQPAPPGPEPAPQPQPAPKQELPTGPPVGYQRITPALARPAL